MNKYLLTITICAAFYIRAAAHPGVGIVMDSRGNVFYTDLRHVWKIGVDNKHSIAVRNVHTHEIYIDHDDNLYGEHLWYEGDDTGKWGHYVWKLSASGAFEKIIPDRQGFLQHYSFVRDKAGYMYEADRRNACQRVIRITPGEKEVMSPHCFNDIRWMTATPAGDVYLIDKTDLKKVGKNGDVETLATSLDERKLTQITVNPPHHVMGLWTDVRENTYVAIYGARKVKKVSADKKMSVVAETSIGWSPTGGFVAPNGDFWLLECSLTNKVRVERITARGQRFIYSPTE